MHIESAITSCLTCGGSVWDNRQSKKSARAPDFRCKDNREHVFWLTAARAPRAENGRGGAASDTSSRTASGAARATRREYALTYRWAARVALEVWTQAGIAREPAAIVAAAATVFIQACQGGAVVREGQAQRAPAPPPPPPPPPEPEDQYDDGSQDDDDLPF